MGNDQLGTAKHMQHIFILDGAECSPYGSPLSTVEVRCLYSTPVWFPLTHSPPGCNTTYRPNYFVQNASGADARRIYYGGVPDYLEVSEHAYVEKDLVMLFRAQMCFAQ